MKILLVDDEKELALSLARILTQEGYQVIIAHDGKEALKLTLAESYHLYILDWMLPHITGLEICQYLRQKNITTPVLFLTAKDTLDDRVMGLDVGADDYLIKPFELRELLARVRALLRRSSTMETKSQDKIKVADLELEINNQLAYRNGRMIKLSEKEVKLLEFFSLYPNQLVTQEQIFTYLWQEEEAPSSNVVAAIVRLLRRKIETDNEPILIHTIYGKGYWFGIQK
ncbi:response regulator transcription factor [Geminocystis sp. CENA526]|uniref:response regulator transcription factor n=1 Tax=Geminocystis sp. CENA526 TaxID=1355871 RepID=UPI003D6F59DC